ncbi:unnamed protein product, partial [Nesidiocoris tenuis]
MTPDSGGHDGFLRIYLKLKTRFYWPRMKQQIFDYIKSCQQCQISKFKFRPKPDTMIIPEVSSLPFEHIHLDFGEFSKKKEGQRATKSFLVAVDEFSRFTVGKAMNGSSRAVVQYLSSLPWIDK